MFQNFIDSLEIYSNYLICFYSNSVVTKRGQIIFKSVSLFLWSYSILEKIEKLGLQGLSFVKFLTQANRHV